MPASIAHYFLGKLLLEEHFQKDLDSSAYYLGCQGPDLFFYSFKFYDMASDFHKAIINKPVDYMVKYAKTKNDEVKKLLLSYIKGYITHHSLDSIAHPYVFFLQAAELEKRGLDAKYNFYIHRELEMNIDIHLARHILGEKTKLYRPYQHFRTDYTIKNEVALMYEYVFYEIYDRFYKKSEILHCFNRFQWAMRVAYSPYGIKKVLVKSVEKILGVPYKYSALFYTLSSDSTFDVLNEHKTAWCNPFEKSITSNASFLELFERAKQKAKERIICFNKELSNFKAYDIIGGINMDTGLIVDKERDDIE